MGISVWQEFLSDNELNASQYLTPNGKYLFGKILHDVLECLNMYVENVKLLPKLAQTEYGIPQKTSNWLNSRIPIVELLLSEIIPLWQLEKELPVKSDEWPQLIERVGVILEQGFPFLLDGYRQLEMPVDRRSPFIRNVAINKLRRLELIWIDIQNREYKRLWMTRKYDVS